jgi:dUTPase
MPLNQQVKKRITVLGGVVDPDYHAEIGLHLHNGDKEDYGVQEILWGFS